MDVDHFTFYTMAVPIGPDTACFRGATDPGILVGVIGMNALFSSEEIVDWTGSYCVNTVVGQPVSLGAFRGAVGGELSNIATMRVLLDSSNVQGSCNSFGSNPQCKLVNLSFQGTRSAYTHSMSFSDPVFPYWNTDTPPGNVPVLHYDPVAHLGVQSGYRFGLAQTEAGPFGWYGEDCTPGERCHDFSGTLHLTSVHPAVGGSGIGAIVPGSTTLTTNYFDIGMTYYVRGDDSGTCVVFGHQPEYYAPMGCQVVED